MKTKGIALCLCYHGVSRWAFGTCCCNMRKNHKVYSLCNKQRGALAKVVLAPPSTTNSRCWNPRVRMWEMARTCSRFIHCWAPFLAFDQKYLCTPSPIVETNENFYTGTRRILNTPRDAFIPLLIFSSFLVHERITANCKKYINLDRKREQRESSGISLNTAELISNCFQGISWPSHSNLIWICVKPVSCVH